jgi:hypothetical protein
VRLISDAEAAASGIVRRTLDEKLQRGEEPTCSAVLCGDGKRIMEPGLRHIG